jgi:hypothetical protein
MEQESQVNVDRFALNKCRFQEEVDSQEEEGGITLKSLEADLPDEEESVDPDFDPCAVSLFFRAKGQPLCGRNFVIGFTDQQNLFRRP